MTNLYVPRRYDEGIERLALGIEPRDALTGRATTAPLDGRFERIPLPVGRWRRWRPGETLTDVLDPISRHVSGRFVLVYGFSGDDRPPSVPINFRLADRRVSARGARLRRFVPRRFRLEIERRSRVEDSTVPPVLIDRRSVALTLFPGSSAPLDPRATVIRGRVLGPPDADGLRPPRRWCRVAARETSTGDPLGWAHGDDRGEFVLVIGQDPASIGRLGSVGNDRVTVTLTIGAQIPEPDPGAADPLLIEKDPLWDLPIERFGPGPWPVNGPPASGRRFLPEHQQFRQQPLVVPLGRTSTREIDIN